MLDIDQGLLQGLFEIDRFESGSRSLEFLCQQLRSNSSGTPRRSQLPGDQLLNMHVDPSKFWAICERDLPHILMAQKLAPELHEAYRLRIKGDPSMAKNDVPFSDLPKELQGSNTGQALRIPRILGLVGLGIAKGPVIKFEDLVKSRNKDEVAALQKLAENLEFLAEAEHNFWMVGKIVDGWRYCRDRNNGLKLHNQLVPYSQLTEEIKDYDRLAIVGKPAPKNGSDEEQFGFIDNVKLAGFKVVTPKV